jgi:hypothetical protein
MTELMVRKQVRGPTRTPSPFIMGINLVPKIPPLTTVALGIKFATHAFWGHFRTTALYSVPLTYIPAWLLPLSYTWNSQPLVVSGGVPSIPRASESLNTGSWSSGPDMCPTKTSANSIDGPNSLQLFSGGLPLEPFFASQTPR